MQINTVRTLYATPPTAAILISTIDKNNRNNIAPFAWWNVVSKDPPLIAVSLKPTTHTYRIIKEQAEFTIGVPDPGLLDAVYLSAHLDREPDEFAKLGLTAVSALQISAPKIKECQVNIECRFRNEFECGDHILVIGEVVAVDVRDDLVHEDDAVMRKNLKPLGHLSGNKFITMEGVNLEASKPQADNKSGKE